MKFGIFYELQLPRPWAQGDEHRLYQNALDQIEMADRLGYDHAWQVEHHFLEEYSHSPAPESFLAAASQRTKQIRLGHGIIQLTTNHPARVAEKVATLDLLSRGRVEFGMGESASTTELEPFGVTMEQKRDKLVLPLQDKLYARMKVERQSLPSAEDVRRALRAAATTSSDVPDAITLQTYSYDRTTKTVSLSGDVSKVGPRSMTVLATFVDNVAALPVVSSVVRPSFERAQTSDGSWHSPFSMTLTLRD